MDNKNGEAYPGRGICKSITPSSESDRPERGASEADRGEFDLHLRILIRRGIDGESIRRALRQGKLKPGPSKPVAPHSYAAGQLYFGMMPPTSGS
jgi:hypothetical protein